MAPAVDATPIDNPRHFIPYRRDDIVKMCLQDHFLSGQEEQFRQFHRLLTSVFHFEFHSTIEQLKNAYAAVDPDLDTRSLEFEESSEELEFVSLLQSLLEKANYKTVSKQDLQHALNESSLFKIRLHVNFDDFSQVLLFCRGESTRCETVYRFMGRFPREVEFINYDRVLIYIRFRDDYVQQDNGLPLCKPGATMLKLFRNVPRADLDMLFPNTQVGMRMMDKLLIGIPAAISGGIVVSTKLATSLLLVGSLLGFWLGVSKQPVELDKTTLMILLAGIATLGGYLWKQFNAFKNRKLSFTQSLTKNLYFKNLDNNAGVFYRLANDAEEEECKEAILAYYFLLTAETAMTENELDLKIENWFDARWNCEIDFDIADALHKLVSLKLAEKSNGLYTVIPLNRGIETLGQRWDNYFN